jgi:ribose 5-phosphate isomerase B
MVMDTKIAIGSDAVSYYFKVRALKELSDRGYGITDFGGDGPDAGEYPVIAESVARRVAAGEFERGLLICGTGQGMVIAANKVPGIRAALCFDTLHAILSREHNNTNILCTGAWLTTIDRYLPMVEAWLYGRFSGTQRHVDRLEYVRGMESG